MSESLSELVAIAKEVRDLLLLIAEPAIAQRDQKLRTSLKEIVGRSSVKADAVLQMDGTKIQSEIVQAGKIFQGDLSKLVKALKGKDLLEAVDRPKLKIAIPKGFFDSPAEG